MSWNVWKQLPTPQRRRFEWNYKAKTTFTENLRKFKLIKIKLILISLLSYIGKGWFILEKTDVHREHCFGVNCYFFLRVVKKNPASLMLEKNYSFTTTQGLEGQPGRISSRDGAAAGLCGREGAGVGLWGRQRARVGGGGCEWDWTQ